MASIDIDTAALLKTISALENQLSTLKGQLGASAGVKAPKKKRAVNPDAKPNPWLEFLGRVRAVVKESKVEGPATIGVLFAKSLKDSTEGAYEMEAGAIADAFTAWATPENIEHAKSLKKSKKEKEEEASESGSVAPSEGEAEPKADKPKRVLSDEQKAKMKAGREAAKAAKAAAAAAEGGAPVEEAPKEAVKGSGGEGKAKPEQKHAPPKMEPKKVAKKSTYTIEQLQDWSVLEYEGEEFGVNVRGDVIDSDSEFVGHWDVAKKTLDRKASKPADWDTFMA